MKNKHLFILLLFVTVARGSWFGFAHAETSGAELIFNMDMSAYDSENCIGLKNSVSESTEFMYTLDKNLGPELSCFDSVNGITKYLTFAKFENGVKSRNSMRVMVMDPTLVNKKEETIEIWVRSNALISGDYTCDRLFTVEPHGNTDEVNRTWECMLYSGSFYLRPGRKSDGKWIEKVFDMKNCNERWTHLVFTRSFDDATSKWTYQTFVNGERLAAGCGSAEGVFKDETGMGINIGSGEGNNQTVRGDISAFRIYNGVLSSQQVADNYNSQMASYRTAPDIVDSGYKYKSNRYTISFSKPVSLTNGRFGSVVDSENKIPVPCIPEIKGNVLNICFCTKLIPNREYIINFDGLTKDGVYVQDSVRFTAEIDGLFPVTEGVYKKPDGTFVCQLDLVEEDGVAFEQFWHNYGSEDKTVTAIVAGYSDNSLIKADFNNHEFKAGTTYRMSSELDMSETKKPYKVDSFIWNDMKGIAPVTSHKKNYVLDGGRTADGDFAIEYYLPFSVSVNEINRNNITLLRMSDGVGIQLNPIEYLPNRNVIKLSFSADYVDENGFILSFRDSSGTTVFSDMVYARQKLATNYSGISVAELELWDKNGRVYDLTKATDINGYATVENYTGKALKNIKYKVYSTKNLKNVLAEGTFSLELEGNVYIDFCINKSQWEKDEEIAIIFEYTE